MQPDDIPWNPAASGKKMAAALQKTIFLTGVAFLSLFLSLPPAFASTADDLNLKFAQDNPGGGQFAAYLDSWWNNQFLPALKDMTKQLHAERIDETRQLGAMMDAQAISRLAVAEQNKKLHIRNSDARNELTCISGSYQTALSQSSRIATALTKGLKQDMGRRSANAPGTTAEGGPAVDQRARWTEYCTEFHDPNANNGVSACPNAEKGHIVNGDIDIENFLLKDTINMANPDEVKASVALLQNLVQPVVKKKIPEAVVNTATGKEWILKQQHLESVRNIASDVVASIISRRESMSGTNVGTTIKPIRLKAGIDPAKISDNPSYNEIMLAMTKERFFDPGYFIHVHAETGSIGQEQTAIGNFITLQYQDINKMQEQISALMAARAALKLNSDAKPDQIESNPLR